MSDRQFDMIIIGMALVTCVFAAVSLVWIRCDRQRWQDIKRRHLIDTYPYEDEL